MKKKDSKQSYSISYDKICSLINEPNAKIHFIGIGGVSVYSLARLTMLLGASVSGSDREESTRTLDLSLLGAKITVGHRKENVIGATLVVYTRAISDDNSELSAARENNIPTVSRAEYLGALMLGYKSRIGVSGSHGKSTTVAMLDAIFTTALTDPTVLSGAELDTGSPLRVGGDSVMIYEACEYCDSFLSFLPTIAVGLNLELDHTDYFPDLDAISDSFSRALGRAERFALICGDDENLTMIKNKIKAPIITFGASETNDYRYSVTSFRDGGFDFDIIRYKNKIGSFRLNIPGAFNVCNATAAIVVALEYGIDLQIIRDSIAAFRGARGRLQLLGNRFGRAVYCDYAHHPTEISATINALKSYIRSPITVIFKPHTYSRTAALWQDFCASLSLADHLILTDIYPAREDAIFGISSERLARDIKGAKYLPDGEVVSFVDNYTRGAILLMGAGNMDSIKKEIIKQD